MKQTVADKLQAAEFAGYQRGQREMSANFKAEKIAQMRAITEMLEQAGRIMSRAGYLLGKANGDNSR